MKPSERLRRIRDIARQAGEQADAERIRPRDLLARDLELTRRLVMRLRLREFRNLTMTGAELAEFRAVNDEMQNDADDARCGNASRDAMK
jgi:hypothetical protein